MTKKTTYLYDDQGPGDRRPLASVGELKSEISAVALDLVASVWGGQGEEGGAAAAPFPQGSQASHIEGLAAATQGFEEGGVEGEGAG